MITKSKLSVSIHDVEFSKDYQYMITSQFENQKVALYSARNKQTYQLLSKIPSSPIIRSYTIYPRLILFKDISSYCISNLVCCAHAPSLWIKRLRKQAKYEGFGRVLFRVISVWPTTYINIQFAYQADAKICKTQVR